MLARRWTVDRWRHRHRVSTAEHGGHSGNTGPSTERSDDGGRLGASVVTSRPDVDDSELDQRREREDQTRRHPHVDRLFIHSFIHSSLFALENFEKETQRKAKEQLDEKVAKH